MEKAMEEMRKDIMVIKTDLRETNKMLKGNGKIGIAEMSRRSFEFVQSYHKSKNGLFDWGFRVFIGVLISYVALKVGLK